MMFDKISRWLKEPVGNNPKIDGQLLRHRWDLNLPLVSFSPSDFWTIGHACEGTIIFGATGSGKTSGSGRMIAKSYLNHDFGGIVLCDKANEAELWKRYAAETGREEDIVLFSKEKFNPIVYETKRTGSGAGETENIVNLLMQIFEIAAQKHGRGSGDDYWERATKQMLRNSVDLVKLASGKCSLVEIFDVVATAPKDMEEVASEEWKKKSVCFAYIQQGEALHSNNPDYLMTVKYWLQEFPAMDGKPRSSIVSMFTSLADAFLRGELRKRFSADTTWIPEMSLAGKILIVDLPVKEYAELGKYAAVLIKYLTQKAVERREDLDSPDARPVFLWADEAHNFATSYDQLFQTTARAARGCTVNLTQNISNYLVAIGNESGAKAKVDSFLGNLQTKIFHQQGDPVTNEWASNAIGKIPIFRSSSNKGSSWSMSGPSWSDSTGTSETLDYDCQPREFTTLRKGGSENQFLVDAIIWQSGRQWSHGGVWLKTNFNQRS